MPRRRKCGRESRPGCTSEWSRSRKTPCCGGRASCWATPRSAPSMPFATGSSGRISRRWGCPAIWPWAGMGRTSFCRRRCWSSCWMRSTKRPSRPSCGSSSCFPAAGMTAGSWPHCCFYTTFCATIPSTGTGPRSTSPPIPKHRWMRPSGAGCCGSGPRRPCNMPTTCCGTAWICWGRAMTRCCGKW